MPRKLLLLPPLSACSALRVPRARPAAPPAMNAARTGYRVFSANSTAACTELAKRITERLGAELGKSVVYQETNGETRVEIKESVRGQDIFIIQTIPRDVNTAVMELLIMAYALKTACARNIIGVIPYFPYSKQSKMRKRGSIVCKLLASMLAKAGLTHIITMDLHQKEIQGFFSFPVDNLRASPFLLQYIQEEVSGRQQTPCPVLRDMPHVLSSETCYERQIPPKTELSLRLNACRCQIDSASSQNISLSTFILMFSRMKASTVLSQCGSQSFYSSELMVIMRTSA